MSAEHKKTELPRSNGIEPLSADQGEVFTADPATFLVVNAVVNRVRESVSELKSLLCQNKPELERVVDKALAALHAADVIKVFGDRIVVLHKTPDVDLSKQSSADFLGKVADLMVKRIVANCKAAPETCKDQLRWFALPDHPEIRRRMLELNLKFMREMRELMERAAEQGLTGDGVRLSLLLTGNMEPEDFQ
jgi:hypothetical protein